mmetsp:Transcript_32034/g.75310  ORF Transcript_32034/g.75310 Transcript_32034/m.75310 type:complete len:86 (+) Transcript_32034:1322-1579(+)
MCQYFSDWSQYCSKKEGDSMNFSFCLRPDVSAVRTTFGSQYHVKESCRRSNRFDSVTIMATADSIHHMHETAKRKSITETAGDSL